MFALPHARVLAPGWRTERTEFTSYIETQHPGAYQKFDVSGTSNLALIVDTAPLQAGKVPSSLYPTVRAVVDGVPQNRVLILPGEEKTILASDLTHARHYVLVQFTCGNNNGERWVSGPPNVLRVTDLIIDSGGSLLSPAHQASPGRHAALFYTDSLGEYEDAFQNDATRTYPTLLSNALGWEHEHVAFSGTGYFHSYTSTPPLFTPGDAAQTTFDKYDAEHTRLVGGKLLAEDIFIGLGTNDNAVAYTALTQRVEQTLSAIRAKALQARLWIILPLTQSDKHAAIVAGIETFIVRNRDTLCFVLDIGAAETHFLRTQHTLDGTHLTAQGQQHASRLLLGLIQSQNHCLG